MDTWTKDPAPIATWGNPPATRRVRVTEAGDRRVLEQDTTHIRVIESSFVQSWGETADPGAAWTTE
jgi:hypothetical protein